MQVRRSPPSPSSSRAVRTAGGEAPAPLPGRHPPCTLQASREGVPHPTHPTTPRMWNEQFAGDSQAA